MMKRTIKFSRLFVPCIILSGALMIFSIAGLTIRGINFGLDFQAGFIEKVRIAPTAFTLSYEGPKTVMVSVSSLGLDLTATAVDGNSEAMSFPYSQYQTFAAFEDEIKKFEGLKIVLSDGVARDAKFANLFVDSQILPRLSTTPYKVHYISEDAKVITADEIRNALKDADLPSDAVQQVGRLEDGIFQIRLPDDGSDAESAGATQQMQADTVATLKEKTEAESAENVNVASDVACVETKKADADEVAEDATSEPLASNEEKTESVQPIASSNADGVENNEDEKVATETVTTNSEKEEAVRANASMRLQAKITGALHHAFGENNIVVLSTDFVGSRFSTSLARQAVVLVLGALCLIFLYAMVRFRWDFALGGILALLHDTLAIFAFIVWTQMEFNSISIAAVLTIIGYSINDTVVIFDRIRENISLHPKEMCTDILDISLSEVLGRTIITTITTMLAAFALYYFTQGGMKDFAMCLIVGMFSGTYSSIYIASACINFISRKKKGEEIFVAKTGPTGGISI